MAYDNRLTLRRLGRRGFLFGGAAAGMSVALAACSSSKNNNGGATNSASTQAAGGAVAGRTPAAIQVATPAAPALASTAASAASPAANAKRGGTLKVPIVFQSGDWDPHQFVIAYQIAVWRCCANGLMTLDPATGNPTTDLASAYSFEDKQTLVIKLNPNAKWQDKAPVSGRSLTAQDVKFNIERLSTNSPDYPRHSDFEPVDRVEAVDDKTVRFILKRPYAPMTAVLATSQNVMVPPEVVQQNGDLKNPKNIIGSGPFMADQVDGTNGATVKRNPNYWQPGLPYLDGVQWQIINDPQTSLAAFRSGDLDLHQINAIDLNAIKSLSGSTVDRYSVPSYFLNCLAGQVDQPPTNDARLRQAISLGLDRVALGAVVYPGGEYQVGGVFAHPFWSIPSAEIVQRPGFRTPKDQDLTDAKQALAAAGYPNGITLTVSTSPSFPSFHLDRAQAEKAQLAKIGITLNIDAGDYAQWKERERNKRFQLTTGAYGYQSDPDQLLFSAFSSQGARNYFGYADKDYDAMMDKERAEFDVPTRQKLILDAQRKLLDDDPVAFTGWFTYAYMGRRNYVKGLQLGGSEPSGSNAGDQGFQFKTVWLDK